METRIQFGTSIKLDNPGSIFQLVYLPDGKKALQTLYFKDIEAVKKYHVPIILNAPTWRASSTHINAAGFSSVDAVEKINFDCIQFVKNVRDQFEDYKDNIFITAPVGPEKTDYQADLNLTIDKAMQYHLQQAKAIANAGVDIISIASMAGAIETIGCARAMATTGLPYSVGVVLKKDGTLIDGTPFAEVIDEVDKLASPQPIFYAISCTHPSVAAAALRDDANEYRRVLAIKANGSSKSPEELLKLKHPESDSPELFAAELIALGKKYHFKIYGGCCGTNTEHLEALAKALS